MELIRSSAYYFSEPVVLNIESHTEWIPCKIGYKGENITDTAVRRCEQSTSLVNIPTWISDDLYPLYAGEGKVLRYGEGCFFVKHKDSPKGPGHVGNLVILPAKWDLPYEGGDLILYGERKEVYSQHKRYLFRVWIPMGVEHEITPVTSGVRYAMVYPIYRLDFSTKLADMKTVTKSGKGKYIGKWITPWLPASYWRQRREPLPSGEWTKGQAILLTCTKDERRKATNGAISIASKCGATVYKGKGRISIVNDPQEYTSPQVKVDSKWYPIWVRPGYENHHSLKSSFYNDECTTNYSSFEGEFLLIL